MTCCQVRCRIWAEVITDPTYSMAQVLAGLEYVQVGKLMLLIHRQALQYSTQCLLSDTNVWFLIPVSGL